MKIIQQPDILSFAGNMNDFVIEDVAKSLVFKLSVDGMVIVDEVYVAEGGEVRVSMKDIVDCFLSISIPRADSDYIIQSLAVKKFKAEIEDSVIEFTVVKGGISNVAESSAVFLKTQWLTLQPQEKRIVMHQPEYLSYYAMVACLIKMTVYLADGSANETLLALEAGNLYTVDVSYLKISGKFDRVVGCYDVWVENEAGQRLTYVQRYILSQSNTETNVYLFENTLGGIDSVVFTGRFTEKIQTEGTVTTVLEESTDSDIDLNFSCEQNTGFIPSIDYARWLRSFFVSKQRYHVAGALRRIYLRESENGFTKNSLNDFTFEFFYSKQTKYDVVTRNRDDLPHLLEFPEVDSIPFLAPRLAEFPIAVVADDLMLPVQYAFENAWRRISIAAITQAVSEGAIDKIDLSSYWKKTELVRDGLYLKFLDKYKLKPKEYFFVREVSVGTVNYAGQSAGAVMDIASKIPQDKKVLFSLEDKSIKDMYPKDWILLEEPVEGIHSLIYYSCALISSGDSMAREAALLGVPSYYLGIRYDMPANYAASRLGVLHNRKSMDFEEWIECFKANLSYKKEQENIRGTINRLFIDINEYMYSFVNELEKRRE